MIRKISAWLRLHVGLVGVAALLCYLSIVNVRPGLYDIGWDNYSSYLGGVDSLFRTFFSVWRDYRGIGVPGDSESTDVFRQVVLLALAPIVVEPMRDQVYMLLCLWLGVLAVYFVSVRILRRMAPNAHATLIDFAGAIASGAYLLNLNTVSTFYFPIITYITRYAAIPLLVWMMDRYLYDKNSGSMMRMIFLGIICFSAGSAITATVFLTTMVLLVLIVLIGRQWGRGTHILGVLFAVNAFWILPFFHYAIEKSYSLRLAPAFIDTNESQLNQAPQAYALWKQIIMYPNFFYTRYTQIDTGVSHPIFPGTVFADSPIGQGIAGIVPVLALLGMLMLVVQAKKYYRFMWIPATFWFFVILSSQEQSPLGFIPAFLNRIPYFSVIFRFGDTKFHPYIAVTMALAVGIGLVLTSQRMQRSAAKIMLSALYGVLVIIVPVTTLFSPLLKGSLFPGYLFTVIPDAYRAVAKHIQASPERGRLMHFPYDPKLYWRSHAWGYMGSAFWQYLLPVPYIDKTFEPASLETTDVFVSINDIVRDANQATGDGVVVRAERLAALLKRQGVSWIVFDESVTPEVRVKNMRYWGTYNTTDAAVLLAAMEKIGLVERELDLPINLTPIGATYAKTLGTVPQEPLGSPHLRLYRLRQVDPVVSFVPHAVSVDASLSRTAVIPTEFISRQTPNADARQIYPFLYKNARVLQEHLGLALQLPVLMSERAEPASVTVPEGEGDVIEVRGAIGPSGSLVVSLSAVESPDMGSGAVTVPIGTLTVPQVTSSTINSSTTSATAYLSNWHILPHTSYSDYRVDVGGMILPIPVMQKGESYVLGTVLTKTTDINISIYKKNNQKPLDPKVFTLTDNPNCFGDRMHDYTHGLIYSDDVSVTLSERNGTACVVYPAPVGRSPHTELLLTYRATATDDPTDRPSTRMIPSAGIAQGLAALSKPRQMAVCLAGLSDDRCLNTHQMMRVRQEDTVIFPTESDGSELRYIRLALVPVGLQEQSVTIAGTMITYETLAKATMAVPARVEMRNIRLPTGALTVRLPYILSRGAFIGSARDGWFVSNRPCEISGGYRTTLQMEQGVMSALSNCYNELSVPIPFDSALSRLWAVSYAVFSGKQPTMLLGDPFGHYVDEYLSLYQGYPTVPGMFSLQPPQQWYRSYTAESVSAVIRQQQPVWSHVIVPAAPELTDTRRKSYTIHQDSKNTGIFGVYGMIVLEMPEAWRTMRVDTGADTTGDFSAFRLVSAKSVLPSVMQLTVDHENTRDGRGLLVHRVAYDKNWQAFPDMVSAILGIRGITPDRCDGVFACYVLPATSDTWYLVYAPERLASIGWILAILSSLAFTVSFRTRSRPSNT